MLANDSREENICLCVCTETPSRPMEKNSGGTSRLRGEVYLESNHIEAAALVCRYVCISGNIGEIR